VAVACGNLAVACGNYSPWVVAIWGRGLWQLSIGLRQLGACLWQLLAAVCGNSGPWFVTVSGRGLIQIRKTHDVFSKIKKGLAF
jgi:hypothetical protein